jgi:hypothetical protein
MNIGNAHARVTGSGGQPYACQLGGHLASWHAVQGCCAAALAHVLQYGSRDGSPRAPPGRAGGARRAAPRTPTRPRCAASAWRRWGASGRTRAPSRPRSCPRRTRPRPSMCATASQLCKLCSQIVQCLPPRGAHSVGLVPLLARTPCLAVPTCASVCERCIPGLARMLVRACQGCGGDTSGMHAMQEGDGAGWERAGRAVPLPNLPAHRGVISQRHPCGEGRRHLPRQAARPPRARCAPCCGPEQTLPAHNVRETSPHAVPALLRTVHGLGASHGAFPKFTGVMQASLQAADLMQCWWAP